jgi:multimeric flavodoxin WrbA
MTVSEDNVVNTESTMKHVVAINGSPKKATTFKLLREIAAMLEVHQIKVTILNLGDYAITECIGCEQCIRKTSVCFQDDDAQSILSQLVNADGVILASPVYVMNIPGKLKSLIDKTASWVHRPKMAGKPVLFVSTTAGAGLKDVMNYLEKVAVQWGAYPTGKIGRSITNKLPPSYAELKSFIWHLNNSPSSYTPSLRQLLQYQVQKALALNVIPLDVEYWTQQKWDKQLYYYPTHVSLLKRGIAQAFFKYMDRQVRDSVVSVQSKADLSLLQKDLPG